MYMYNNMSQGILKMFQACCQYKPKRYIPSPLTTGPLGVAADRAFN